ncbi:protein of unknown function [Streptomyces sp. KY70]|nr:protein of unknown function [Streptomyces sp. KY70]
MRRGRPNGRPLSRTTGTPVRRYQANLATADTTCPTGPGTGATASIARLPPVAKVMRAPRAGRFQLARTDTVRKGVREHPAPKAPRAPAPAPGGWPVPHRRFPAARRLPGLRRAGATAKGYRTFLTISIGPTAPA